jgi:uncharacterized protein YegL
MSGLKMVIPFFFMIDAAGCMHGARMADVNKTMYEVVLPVLSNLSDKDAIYRAMIAELAYSTGSEWRTDGLRDCTFFQSVRDESEHLLLSTTAVSYEHRVYFRHDIDASGLSDFGSACIALNAALSRKSFMNIAPFCAPVVIAISSGASPTDNWQKGIHVLKDNNWFKCSFKSAVILDTDYDKTVWEAFTDNENAVFTVRSGRKLRQTLRHICQSVFNGRICKNRLSDKTCEDMLVEMMHDLQSINQINDDEWYWS